MELSAEPPGSTATIFDAKPAAAPSGRNGFPERGAATPRPRSKGRALIVEESGGRFPPVIEGLGQCTRRTPAPSGPTSCWPARSLSFSRARVTWKSAPPESSHLPDPHSIDLGDDVCYRPRSGAG